MNKLPAAILYSLICLTLLLHLANDIFYPFEIKVEIRSSQADRCQLFYSGIFGFDESQSVLKHYSSVDSFSTLVFKLPKGRFNKNLRIDPGFHSDFYDIRKIEIRTNEDAFIWNGREILNGFNMVNLREEKLQNDSYIRLLAKDNSDAQLILQQPVNSVIGTINKPAALFIVTFVFLIWLAGVMAILFFNKLQSLKLPGRVPDLLKDCSFLQNLRLKNSRTTTFYSKFIAFTKTWWLFAIFLGFVFLDRMLTLVHFGFVFTDIDQTVMWNGTVDYAAGIFHEPFFYGQNYNFMLEAMLAVPLLWMNIPVYVALPLATTGMVLLPFIALGVYLQKMKHFFWAYLCLTFPLILPLEFNLLTTLSRGVVQAHLFVPLLLIPLFWPKNKKSVAVLYISSALCIVANQSSIILVIPVFFYVFAYHYKSLSFYTKALWALPILVLYPMAEYFYKINPDSVLITINGLSPNLHTFISNLFNPQLFNHLFPFVSGWGILYLYAFELLLLIALLKKKKKQAIFIFSMYAVLVFTLAIPKVFIIYEGAGIFYTTERFYLLLPLLLIIALFFIFGHLKFSPLSILVLFLACVSCFTLKNYNIKMAVEQIVSQTTFPVAANQKLLERANNLRQISAQYEVGMIVNHATNWAYVFDGYAFYPLSKNDNKDAGKTISVNISGDRRTWLYDDSVVYRQILLNGIDAEEDKINTIDHKLLSDDLILIKNNQLSNRDLFKKLNLTFGNEAE